MTINPKDITVQRLFRLLLDAVAPRPIALASTIDTEGRPNLSPFSFFNTFGANPPVLVFSPSRRGRDNTTKDTYNNLKLVPEVVIHMVSYAMVEQVNLASSDFPAGVNEFEKAGFTAVASDLVRPFRVKESPVSFECKVLQIIETGDQGSAGNLVICEVLRMHIDDRVQDDNGRIDPRKIDLVARMGGEYYCRAQEGLFTLKKPGIPVGIGIDQLPDFIRFSPHLSGNDLGKLGMLPSLPTPEEVEIMKKSELFKKISQVHSTQTEIELFNTARVLINNNQAKEALSLLMLIQII